MLKVQSEGYFYSQLVIESFIESKKQEKKDRQSRFAIDPKTELTQREIEFIKLCCSELTYKEIADKMNITPRTVDGYRESVFLKLELKSRTGIVLFAVNEGYYRISK
ncbi:MAG: helix-turn-helix transcriptional regulator [Bacteroidetes bacterium]|nr:helix-turn-helix transcriptional regulator [Bacteroidota bacterium]